MNNNFIVKKINRVILVGKNEYQQKNTIFTHNLKSNELILHISGKAQVKFNGKILNCESGTIRFLPKGENKEYIVEREELCALGTIVGKLDVIEGEIEAEALSFICYKQSKTVC